MPTRGASPAASGSGRRSCARAAYEACPTASRRSRRWAPPTLGGVVTLEYDESPVGAYREYVTMGALVTKRGAVGQWGSRLCVSTPTAEAVCREVWGVPAQLADIELCEEGEALAVERPPPPSTGAEYYDGDGADGAAPVPIRVSGWAATRSAAAGAAPIGGLPVLWTPQIKALWAPLVPLPADGGAAAAAQPPQAAAERERRAPPLVSAAFERRARRAARRGPLRRRAAHRDLGEGGRAVEPLARASRFFGCVLAGGKSL